MSRSERIVTIAALVLSWIQVAVLGGLAVFAFGWGAGPVGVVYFLMWLSAPFMSVLALVAALRRAKAAETSN